MADCSGENGALGSENALRDSLSRLIAAYETQLLRHATRLTGNAATAEDLVQNTFIKVIHHWHNALEPSPQLSSWLYRVLQNEAIDHIRREKRRRVLLQRHSQQSEIESEIATSPAEANYESAEAANRAMASLSERERLLVTLKVYEQRSYREIAEITGLSSGNVGFILHGAMKKMARILQGEEADGGTPQ